MGGFAWLVPHELYIKFGMFLFLLQVNYETCALYYCLLIQVCGASEEQELPENFMKLPKDAYTPDLIAASDCMLGKLSSSRKHFLYFSLVFSFLFHFFFFLI